MAISKEKDNKFNPNDHLENIKGKPYLPVAWRLVWFREEKPNWEIFTEEVESGDNYSKFKATIKDENGKPLATAHKREDKAGFADYMEKAETGAIGRALAMCGFGTQFSPEIEEGTERIVDSPVSIKVPEKIVQEDIKVSKPANETIKKMYFAVAKSVGYDAETAKEKAKKAFGLNSFNDITQEQVQKLLTKLSEKVNKDRENSISEGIVQDLESFIN